MKRSILALAVVALGACGNADGDAAVKAMVSADFHHPASAQWRNLQRFDAAIPGQSWVCGEVNAKNLMGAYTGFRGFVANEAQKQVVIEPDGEVDESSEAGRLARANYRIARGFCTDRR